MIRRSMIVAVMLIASVAAADPISVSRARNSLADLTAMANDLAKEAQRDAAVLAYLREAAKSLDDWQQNNAVAGAMNNIGQAGKLAAQAPVSPRVVQIVSAAKEIVEPATHSAMTADLQKIRGELLARPVEQMRGIVAEEIGVLAQMAAKVSDISGILTKSVAASTAVTLGTKSE
jgi:hypothetical protein